MKNHSVLFGALLIVSLLLRTVQLDRNPAGFFRDEADKGYTTYSLIETGQDQTGKPYPVFVRSLRVTTSALYQYIDMPFVYFWGLNEFAVRLPAALAGTLSVFAAYIIARSLWGNPIALWAGLFVCLSPWSVLLSRWANQSILLTASIPLAVYFLVCNKERPIPKLRNTILSSFFFLIALYTYAPARLFVPVFIIGIWILIWVSVWRSQKNWKVCFLSFILFFFVFTIGSIPLAHHLVFESADSTARLTNITIMRGQPFLELVQEWIRNYFTHLSPSFLFIQGDENMRHNTALYGQLHWYCLPLLLLGIFRAVRKHQLIDQILLLWFLCFPISAACTWESIPHALRSVFAVPIVHLLAAYGIVECKSLSVNYKQIISKKLKMALLSIWISSVLLFSSLYIYDLFWRYPVYSALHWEYGYKQAITWWKEQRKEGEAAVVSGMREYPQWFFLFYDQVDPKHWIEHHDIPGVTFIPLGHDAQPYFNQQPDQKTFYLLALIPHHELPNYRPTKSIVSPGYPPIPTWKWVVIE